MNNKLALVVQFSAVDRLSGSLRNIVGLGRSGSSALRSLQGDARQLKRQMEEAARAIATGSGNVTTLINRERDLAGQLARTTAEIERQKRMLAIDADVSAIQQRGEELQSRGQANIIGGASIAAPLFLAARAGADWSTMLVDIQQKANLTNAETDRMGRTMLRVAAETRQMPVSIAAAVDTLSGLGMDPRDAIQLAPAIGRLGTAFRVDLAEGSAAAYANVNNLQVPLAQTARAIDIMATSGNLGAFEVRDMARAFPSLTGQFQALGESGLSAVGRLSAALQIARQTTGTSDEAANNVENLLAKINAPGTIRAFEKNFGVDLPAALARLRAQGYDTFEAIAMVTQEATGGDMSKLGFAFEDMQAQAGIRTIIQNLDEYRRVRDAAMAGGGTVDRSFDQRIMRDANANWQAFIGTVSTLAVTFGTAFLPTLTEVGNYLTIGMQGIVAWSQANPELSSGIMKAVAALAAMRIGLGVAQYAFGTILGPIARVWGFFRKVDGISKFGTLLSRSAFLVTRGIAIMVRGFGFLRVAAMFLARGLMQAGMMMLANPVVLAITLIVVAIAAAGYLIYRNWDTIKAAFSSGIARLGAAWNWIKANFARFAPMFGPLGIAASFVIRHWGTIRNAFGAAIGFIGSLIPRFLAVGREIVNGLIAGITGNPAGVWNALKNIVLMGVRNIRSFLGIASPSRLFMEMGGFLTEGLAIGIDRGGRQPMSSLARLAGGMAGGLAIAGSPFAASAAVPTGAPTSAQSSAAGPVYNITINAGAGQSPRDIALEVKRILDSMGATASRSSFDDDR